MATARTHLGLAVLAIGSIVAVVGGCASSAPTPEPAAAPKAQAVAPRPTTPEDEVSADRLMATIRKLPTKRSPWGDQAHEEGLRETEAMLLRELEALGLTVTKDPVDFIGRRGGQKRESAERQPYHNLIVEFKGRGPAASEVLILGAHFDAVPNSPGADDNGTGTAALLEAARVLKDRPLQRTIRLAFFNLEEVGLVGSRAYAQRIRPELEAGTIRVVGMVSMDMLGYYTDAPGSQKSPIPPSRFFQPPSVGDFIAAGGVMAHRTFSGAFERAMKEADPRVKTVFVDFLPIAPPDLLRSDHAPFMALGLPAIILSDTADFRSPHYHKPTDTIDTIDVERYTITTRAIIGGWWRLAGGDPEQPLIELSPKSPGESAPASNNFRP
ncbi:MAG: M20/M25/M40 family metallo-hydrolase [Phycisphaerales bacterium]|nr:M20/M25/M40 family metallo-hydrolase [Phycisphaerales bacterium]